MKIYGLVKTSTVDYPEKIVSTVFLGGCNLNCNYCHNSELITPKNHMTEISEKYLMKHLKNRKDIIEGLCITGGEATLHGEKLIYFVEKIREEMGEKFSIKLDTNGTNPVFLKKNLGHFDFIAMDFKTLDYSSHLEISDQLIMESLEILKAGDIDYEIRVTVYPEYIKPEEFSKLAKALQGVKKVTIQQYKPVERGVKETYPPLVLYDLMREFDILGIKSELKC